MGLVFGVVTFAYGGQGTHANASRHVEGRTVFSDESPKAELSVPKEYGFVGVQKIDLYGNAEAEQFVFARKCGDGALKTFYLMQLEHFLPSKT